MEQEDGTTTKQVSFTESLVVTQFLYTLNMDASFHAAAAYDSQWVCDSYIPSRQHSTTDSYVDGGMRFLQHDKSLYVPVCGYYFIYSQIHFKVRESNKTQTVLHQLKFQRNCTDSQGQVDNQESVLMARGTVASNPTNKTTTTTYTGDVVKLCEGGRIWVHIPAGEGRAACCPSGDPQALGGSYFGAILIKDANCNWPPRETMAME